MRITFAVGELMMDAVDADPEDGSALEGERSADGKEIFQPLGAAEAAMRKQSMIADADAERSGDPPEAGGDGNSLPRKVEKSIDRQHMIDHHDDAGKPIDPVAVLG
jgi:hypothetical protein